MQPIAVVTVLALLQLFYFSILVGRQRAKHGIKAPAITGNAEFERTFRIHQNTIEQLIIFIPALWLFGHYVDAWVGTGLGLIFIIARFVYCAAYLKASKRSTGFGLGMLATMILLIGGLVGAVVSWL